MNGKQRFSNLTAPAKGVIIGGLAAAASAIATVVVPSAPAEAAGSPVSPAPVTPAQPLNPNLGGTPVETPTPTPTPTPTNFGPLSAAFVNAQAAALGLTPEQFMALPLVQAAIARFGAGAEAFLAALAAKLQAAGLFNAAAYQNAALINLFNNVANVTDAINLINALSVEQLALLYRLGFTRFGGLPIRRAREFSRIRYFDITLSQMVAYRFTSIRFTGAGGRIVPGLFNRERSNNDDDNN